MRGRPGSGLLLIGEAGLRLAALSLLGSLALALSLVAEGRGGAGIGATWLWVAVRAGLGPDLHPGLAPGGGAPLGLTFLVLALAFRVGQRLGPPGYAALAALPTALAGVVLALLAGELLRVPAALVAAVPPALALAAGSEWWRRQGGGRSNTVLRAGLTAATGVLAGLLLAGLLAALIRVFQPGGYLKVPTEAVVLAGFWPGAVSTTLAGPPALGLLTGLFAPALFLAPRARRERLLCALLAGAALTVVALAAGGGWRTALPSALVGWVCAAVAAGLAPVLGAGAAGHRLAGLPVLRQIGDRLPPPAAVELTAERMRPRGAAAPRRTSPAGLAVSLLAAVTAILCVVAVLAVTLAGQTAKPVPAEQQAAHAYLDALASNNSGRIWATVTVADVQLPAGDHFLGAGDLAHMLAVPANRHQRISSVTLVETARSASEIVYQAAYQEAGDYHAAQLTLGLVGGRWKVVWTPAAIAIPALPASLAVTVDGAALSGPAGQAETASVLPGVHAVKESAGAPFSERSLQVTADQPLPAVAQPDLAPALDPGAAAAARSFAAGVVQRCLASNAGHPAGCPNGVDVPVGTPVTWTSVGPPAADAALQLDANGGLLLQAHYQLIAAYPVHVPEDTKHVAVGGGFSVPVAWTAGAWQAAGAPQAAGFDALRPGAGDAALVDAVRSGFDACAASRLLRPADCPQTLPSSGFVGSVQWHLTGDPVASTTVSFDTQRSLFSVTGTYGMSVTYTEAGAARANNVGGGYRADLFWDGSRPVLVNIART
ncbi:MAG TPA: hypothetical protein VF160_14675 [Candidatus Dormibacteraeota bacterium]